MSEERPADPTDELELDAAALELLLSEVFAEAGLSDPEARRISHALVDAEKCGVVTHGVMRVSWYLDALAAGTVAPYVERDLVVDSGAIAVIDGGGAYGYLPTWQATAMAADRAHALGLALVLVRRSAEFGRGAYYVAELARQGLIGVAYQNNMAQIAAPGADRVVLGNNPLAFAAPGDHGPAYDGAFTVRSGGELYRRRLLGLPVPREWGYLDAEGLPTTEPSSAIQAAQQAAGGVKGFGMALMVDILAGALSGSEHGPALPPGSPAVGAMVLAIDPTKTAIDLETFDMGNEVTQEAVVASGGTWPGTRSKASRTQAEKRGTVLVARGIFAACHAKVGQRLDSTVRS